ncbi:MAG: glycosyltransferase family 4 protein [Chlorobiales bacterium]|nr:glycosyltransferase family 4 protein [Chlorobiales bacterium]
MRLVYLNKVFIDSPLPAVNFTLANAYGLAQAGADTTLMVQKKNAEFKEKTLYEDFHLQERPNFHLNVYPEKSYFGIKTNQWFYLKAFSDIKKMHKKTPIDALISRDPGALPYMARLKKKKGIPVFYQPHNFYLDLSVRPDVNPTNSQKYHLLEKEFLPQMSGILCLQDSQAEWYRKYLPGQKVLVAKPGMFRIEPHAGAGYQRRLIGYVGSLQLKKGINALLEAFKVLQPEGFKLILVGGRNQQEMAEVKQRIYELGLEDKVLITGWVSYEQVEAYLAKISVGIIPLNDIFYNRYLTAPNKLFDYLSRGVPVIASDLPSLRDFVKEGAEGEFVPPENPEALADSIRKIFASEEIYEGYHQRAMNAATNYLWDKQAAKMIEAIRNCLTK